MVKRTIHQYHKEEWRMRTDNDSHFRIFKVFQSSITPSKIWKFFYTFDDIAFIKFVAKLWIIPPTSRAEICGLCQITNKFQHTVLGCLCTSHRRNSFFDLLIDNFNVHLYIEFSQLEEEMMYSFLLRGVEPTQVWLKTNKRYLFAIVQNYLRCNSAL